MHYLVQEAEDHLAKLSEKHEEINVVKTQSLSELSTKSLELKKLIESRKSQLDPLLKELHVLKERHQQLEAQYNQQKQLYDSTALRHEKEKAQLVEDTTKLEVPAPPKSLERVLA